MKNWTRPTIASVSASGTPLYGTCTTSMPAADLNTSAAKCVPLPAPAELKLSCQGFAFAIAIRSCTLFTASELGTSSTYGALAVVVMPERSLRGSYGSFA